MSDSYFVDMRGGIKSASDAVKSGGGLTHPNLKMFEGIDEYDVLADNPRGLAVASYTSILMMRCITVTANTFGGLPLVFKFPDESEVPREHPMRRALSERHTRLWRSLAKDMLIFGTAYWVPTDRGIRRLNPITMEVLKDKHGIQGFRQSIDGAITMEYKPDQVVYFFDYDPEDDLGGKSPTEVALRAAKSEVSLDDFIATFFENDATPGGMLITDQRLTSRQAKEYRTRWEKMFKGAVNRFRVAVMGQGIRWESITPVLKDLVIADIGHEVARRICQAYGVPMTIALATEAANYAVSKESHIAFYTETLLPFADMILDEVNLQLSPFYKGQPVIVEVDRNQIEVLSEDRLEISQRTAQSFQAGYLTINDAREAEGLEPLKGGDVLVIGGQFISAQQLAQGQYPNAGGAGGSFGGGGFRSAAGSIGAPELRPTSFETEDGKVLSPLPRKNATKAAFDNDGYINLSLANDPALVREVASIRRALQDQPLEWLPAEKYHLTLVFAEEPDPASLVRLQTALPSLPESPIRLVQIGRLQDALVLFAEPYGDLLDYQRALVEQARMAGWQIGEYSEPAHWKPHVTIAYGAGAMTADPWRVPFSILTAVPNAVTLYQSGKTSEDFQILAAQKRLGDIRNELQGWEHKALRKHPGAPFRTYHIPRATAAFLAQDLRTLDRWDGAGIKAVFAAYKADSVLETPSEFEQYWQGIDRLNKDLEADLVKWFELARDEIIDASKSGTPDFDAIDGKLADMLVGLLAGSIGDPGSLAKIFLAGAGRANDILKNLRLTGNPTKASEPPNPPTVIETDWDIINQQAVDFARNHAYDMVRGINETTRDIFQQKIAEWSATGGHLDELSDALLGDLQGLDTPEGWSPGKLLWAVSPQRAALIAQTEVTRAFRVGVNQRWQQAGVQKVRWRTQNDGNRVCPQCKRLNNRVGSIDAGIVDPKTRVAHHPPAHPGCRCFQAPVTGNIL